MQDMSLCVAAERTDEPMVAINPPGSSSAAAGSGRSIVAMILAMACFVISDALFKLAGEELPVGEIIFIRGWIATALLIAFGLATGAFRNARTSIGRADRRRMILRTLGEGGAAVCFLTGLMQMPFAEVSAIAQFAPLAITAGAAIFLGEPVGWRRWIATLVGFIGVMIIIKPGTAAFDWAGLWIVTSVLFVTMRDLATRTLSPGMSTILVITISAACVAAASLLLLLIETWKAPTAWALLLMLGAAIGSVGGYAGTVMALRSAELSVVAPFRYTVIIYAVLAGVLIFGERPALSTYIGIVVVIGAGLYMFHRERVTARRARLHVLDQS